MTDLHDELNTALEDTWPTGVPESELVLAGRLSTSMRGVVARRLRAVARWIRESEQGRSNVAEAAAAAGLSKPRFYAVAADWRASRSIASLGARASEKHTRSARLAPDARKATALLIQDVLRDDPGTSIMALVRRLDAAGVPPISYSAVRRLWLEAKRSAPAGAFGAELLFDSVGLDAATDGERMRLYVVIDHGTGLVLGAAEATSRSRSWGFVHAADDACGSLGDMKLEGLSAASGEPVVVLNPQRNDAEGGSVLARRLSDAGITCVVDDRGLGRAAVRTLGERLGSVWIGAGERDDEISYRNGRKARIPEYTASMSIMLMDAVAEHNRRRIAATPAAPSSGELLDQARRSVARVLAVVSESIGDLDALPSYSEAAVNPDHGFHD